MNNEARSQSSESRGPHSRFGDVPSGFRLSNSSFILHPHTPSSTSRTLCDRSPGVTGFWMKFASGINLP